MINKILDNTHSFPISIHTIIILKAFLKIGKNLRKIWFSDKFTDDVSSCEHRENYKQFVEKSIHNE